MKLRSLKWTGVLAALILFAACFMDWVVIHSRQISVSGISSEGTTFGKPGYIHFLLGAFFLLLSFVSRVWAKRANLLIAAMNMAWAIRNFFIISACAAGECPEKKTGLYLILFSSIVMMIASLFPDMKLPIEKKNELED